MTLPVPLSLGSLFSRSRSQSREYERTPLIEKLDRFRPEQQRLRRKAATAKHWILDRIAWARQTHAQRALRLRDGSDTLVDEAETPAAEVKPNGHSRDNSVSHLRRGVQLTPSSIGRKSVPMSGASVPSLWTRTPLSRRGGGCAPPAA